jgi:membrane dipeptidase
VPLRRLIDHVEHIARVAGADAVGLGSDFDGMWACPVGLESVADLPRLTRALARRFDEATVLKILGGNLLRVLATG